jgi:hypothetical protein
MGIRAYWRLGKITIIYSKIGGSSDILDSLASFSPALVIGKI